MSEGIRFNLDQVMTEKDIIVEIVIRAVAQGDESIDRIYRRAEKAAKYLAGQGLLEPMAVQEKTEKPAQPDKFPSHQ